MEITYSIPAHPEKILKVFRIHPNISFLKCWSCHSDRSLVIHSNRTVNFFYWSKNVFSHSEVLKVLNPLVAWMLVSLACLLAGSEMEKISHHC